MTKADLRKKYAQKRKELSSFDRSSLSIEIADRLFKSVDLSGKRTHVFLPIEAKNEINTWLVLDRIKSVGEAVVSVSNFDQATMKHVLVAGDVGFKNNDYGIPEPTGDRLIEVEPQSIDVVLIPLLAFDKKGYRVGYGKGFYDRFLADLDKDCLKIGLSFFEVEEEEIGDINPFDVSMDMCITPNILYTFANS